MNTKFRTVPLLWVAAWLAFAATPAIDPDVYLNDVKFLASQQMRGRGDGSPELEKAAAFIAGQFRASGLQTVNGSSYYQDFPITLSGRLGPANSFQWHDRGRSQTLKLTGDYMPFQFSSAVRVSAPVIFAGYGITAPEYHYDDYMPV